MNWPATVAAMKAEGWRFSNTAVCKGCLKDIEWWVSPNNRKTPINTVTPESFLLEDLKDLRELHFSTCTERDRFKK